MSESPSVQRSFRLSRSTAELLDAYVATSAGENRNSAVERLLAEGLRLEKHPLVRFRTGTAGRREPLIVGTRLKLRQLVADVRAHDNDVVAVATLLEIPESWVRAAMSYYAEFADEVEADIAWAARAEAEEYERWQREQAVLA